MQEKAEYLNRMSDLINPLLNRSGMIINSPFEYLAKKKKLMIVGYNPGNVPDINKTTINEDWLRHTNDESFNPLHESWGHYLPGCHPIQIFYQRLIDNTDLNETDILYTNLYWERSNGIEDLEIDPILEKQCKKAFFLNLETHQPECICFIGHSTEEIVSKEWAASSFRDGQPDDYPWGNQKIKFQKIRFPENTIRTFSIPHQSRFGIGYHDKRLESVLKALYRCLN